MKPGAIRAVSIISSVMLLGMVSIDNHWITLFDGSTTEHWRSVDSDAFPRRGWTIDADGALVCQGGGDLATRQQFGDFELQFEFRINPGGNSGIFYRYQNSVYESPEYQILDDKRHPDAGRGRDGNRSLGALYDVLPPGRKELRSAGTWNTARILARGKHVEHWLNGTKVLEYEITSARFEEAVARSKFSNHPRFARHPRGYIVLQDHRDVVSFRNIRIKKLRQAIKQ